MWKPQQSTVTALLNWPPWWGHSTTTSPPWQSTESAWNISSVFGLMRAYKSCKTRTIVTPQSLRHSTTTELPNAYHKDGEQCQIITAEINCHSIEQTLDKQERRAYRDTHCFSISDKVDFAVIDLCVISRYYTRPMQPSTSLSKEISNSIYGSCHSAIPGPKRSKFHFITG